MKKLLLYLIVLLLVFTGCAKKQTEIPIYTDDTIEAPLDEEFDAGTFVNLTDLRDFFVIESEGSLGTPKYNNIIAAAREDNFVIKPMFNGNDLSLKPEHARIVIKPAEGDNKYNYIAYYYTDGEYNMAINVYYLDEESLNIAKEGGYASLSGALDGSYEKSAYGEYTLVNGIIDEYSYGERILFDKYFVTVTGAHFRNAKYQSTVEFAILDMLGFDKLIINEN